MESSPLPVHPNAAVPAVLCSCPRVHPSPQRTTLTYKANTTNQQPASQCSSGSRAHRLIELLVHRHHAGPQLRHGGHVARHHTKVSRGGGQQHQVNLRARGAWAAWRWERDHARVQAAAGAQGRSAGQAALQSIIPPPPPSLIEPRPAGPPQPSAAGAPTFSPAAIVSCGTKKENCSLSGSAAAAAPSGAAALGR